MAEYRVAAEGENRCHAPALARHDGLPYRVHTAGGSVQAAAGETEVDGIVGHPDKLELPPSDHPVLHRRQCRNRRIDPA